ncbi:telomere repeats-binding bouquet formation protein 1 [Sardina pilchardus]|uniref:telomere repeats-binding bouquet formation protein 1 n=1 Tax=Sardina pilchardus TaxID=27697 RepID=UPI002E0E37A7
MQHATKTDLSLLLECLKCQMKCPDSQKQALLTIYSICQQSGEYVEFFLDLGGVMFVHSLSRASPHPQVKQTALFILGALTESNVCCKQALCRKETFADLVESLQLEVPVTQKRVAVYLLSALVSNNRSGQEFAHSSDCIHVLLNLFRWSFPLSSEAMAVGETQMTQLWTAVSNALCGCVNNPQNDLNQRVCMSAFPLVCVWLQQMSPPHPQLLQPLCSFIAMTLHNNMCAQEFFSSVGGLRAVCVCLADLVPECPKSPPACSMAITLTKTLAACITDNPVLAAGLCVLQLVPVLVLLLSCPRLDPRDQLSVLLTTGLCTDSSEEHQTQLLASGGLPLVISLLTDTQDEELKKAATFVLQTCKKITGMLGPSLGSCHEEEHQSELENHWKSAKDILQRINNLEKQQAGEEQWERDVGNSADQQEGTFGIPLAPPPWTPPLQLRDPPEELWEGTPLRSVKGHRRGGRPRRRNTAHKEPPVRRDIFGSVPEQDLSLESHYTTDRDAKREERERGEGGREERERGEIERQERERETQQRQRITEWKKREKECAVQRERGEVKRERRRDMEERESKRGIEIERESKRGIEMEGERRDMEERESRRGVETERERNREERESRRGRGRIPAQLSSASLTDTYSCQPAEGGKHTDSPHEFRIPDPLTSSTHRLRPRPPSDDEMSICSEILQQEIQRVLTTPASFTHSALRCLGCVSGVCDVSSRSFGALLRSSQQKCETHLLLLRADQRHRKQLKHTHTHTVSHSSDTHTSSRSSDNTHTPRASHTHGSPESSYCAMDTHCESDTHTSAPRPLRESRADRIPGEHTHPPHQRDGTTHTDRLTAVNLTPLKRAPDMPGRSQCREELISEDESNSEAESCSRKRDRRSFSVEEQAFLREGVRRFGPSWNSILWAYPFQPGRTNTDLAHKYRRMKKAEAIH